MALLSTFARVTLFLVIGLALAAALAAPPSPARALPSRAAPRVLGPVDDSQRVTLAGNVHPLVQAAQTNPLLDQGAVEESFPTGRMMLLLKRSPEQETALHDFIQAAHTAGNPAFHQWTSPAEFGRLYGPADSDVAAVRAWLESHGLAVSRVLAGRGAIEFSGTAGQLRQAFHTQIHRYAVNGALHLANATDPEIPAALAPVVAGLTPLNDFHPQPQIEVLGSAAFNPKTHRATPQWTYPLSSQSQYDYVFAPGDFAVEYDIGPVYKAGVTGAGQTIGIISASNVDLSLVQAYQALFSLPANLPAVVVDGADPGQNDAAMEAYLDVEVSGSVAPGASVLLYTSAGTALTNGLEEAALRAVEDDQAGVLSLSYSACESAMGQSGNAFWNNLWQQAAAQGQTVFVSTGDSGSANCDDPDTQPLAYWGLEVNGLASTPYNVAIGGTDFYYSQFAGSSAALQAQFNSYWSGGTVAPATSLLSPIPEQVWNDFFGYNLSDSGNPQNPMPRQNIVAGGGGSSFAALYPSSGAPAGYSKPAWQTGTGVPRDGVRDIPDLSLFAADGANNSFYPICASPGDCAGSIVNAAGAVQITGAGGTSASAPAMAGIQALINQSAGGWQGQADFIYYPLAQKQPSAFHDIAAGGNQVLCEPVYSLDCAFSTGQGNTAGFYSDGSYTAGPGYDLASGLGSVDVANLVKYWSSVVPKPSITTLNINPPAFAHGTTTTVTGTVTASSGTPTGAVSLTANDGLTHYAGLGDFPLVAGSIYASVDNLPGGTYQVTASYSGDGNFAASKSGPVTVTVTPENDTLASNAWLLNPFDLLLYPLANSITVPYGAQIFFDAQPIGGNATIATQATQATGSVSFTDKAGSATTTSSIPLNVSGVAEWSTGVFAVGSHSVSEAYSGDASYNASSVPSAASFTVVPGPTSLKVTPLAATVSGGGEESIDVAMNTAYLPLWGKLPTGTVSVTLGGQTLPLTLESNGPWPGSGFEGVVTFKNVPAGVLPVSATYAGDSNWLGSQANGGMVLALSTKLVPAIVLSVTPASATASATLDFTAALTGISGKPAPTGNLLLYGNSGTPTYMTPINSSSGAGYFAIQASAADNGVNSYTVSYLGDTNYAPQNSNTVQVTVNKSDFSLTTLNSNVTIAPGGSGTATLSLSPIDGFSGAVTIAAGAPPGFTFATATASPTVGATLADVATIGVAGSVAKGIYPVTVTASGSGHIHTAQILVTVAGTPPPTFSPAAGTYTSAQQVTLSELAAGAVIYYTTNGTTPTASSTQYSGAIPVSATETLEAIAVAGGQTSAVASATYTIAAVAATPTFSPAAGTYGATQTVTMADATKGAVLYYTTNGNTPTTSSTKYTAPITVSATETIKAIATATGDAPSAVATAAYTISKVTATPAFSPAAGTYTAAQTVTITDSTGGAAIYYTTNRTTPTTSSTKYTAAIKVSATETLEAIAVASGYSQSAVATALYTINLPAAATPKFSPAAGTYASAQTVTITDATAGATLYYTTNGTTPTTGSTRYTAAIKVSATETLEAIAVATGYSQSAVATAAYKISTASIDSSPTPRGK
jgi:hypothetical protein